MKENFYLKSATGYSIITVFMFMAACILFIEIPVQNREIVVHMIGIIEGAFVGNLINYYYGSANELNKKSNDKL